MTKAGTHEETAPNPKRFFVLNFENWDLRIVWNLGFEYWHFLRLVYPFEKGIYGLQRNPDPGFTPVS